MNSVHKVRVLVVTTTQDISLPLFLTQKISRRAELYFFLYEESLEEMDKFFSSHKFDVIYLRDPFTSRLDYDHIRKCLETIFLHQSTSIFIDNLKGVDDVFLEDKWRQYEILKDLMPKTELLSQRQSEFSSYIIKGRFSSRSRDIFFDIKQVKVSDKYIIQERLPVTVEYRVVVLKGQPLPVVLTKSVKKPGQKVKVIGKKKINQPIEELAKQVHKKMPFDLLGVDIVRLEDDSYKVLEANRSPQMVKYWQLTGVNVIEDLLLGS